MKIQWIYTAGEFLDTEGETGLCSEAWMHIYKATVKPPSKGLRRSLTWTAAGPIQLSLTKVNDIAISPDP